MPDEYEATPEGGIRLVRRNPFRPLMRPVKADELTCKRCGGPTVYKSRICRYCQKPEERSTKASERGNRPVWTRNPRRSVHVVGVIPGYTTEIRYMRDDAHRGPYKHPFAKATNVRQYALSDGSVLLKGRRRIHADDTRPGFGRYTGRNPEGRMARQEDSGFGWWLIIGIGIFLLLQSKSASAGGIPGALPIGGLPGINPFGGGPMPSEVPQPLGPGAIGGP